jgi:hypothetical protein
MRSIEEPAGENGIPQISHAHHARFTSARSLTIAWAHPSRFTSLAALRFPDGVVGIGRERH